MARITVRGRALELWGGLRGASIKPCHITTALLVVFFFLTFIVYQLTSNDSTASNGPVRLADAFLHGRLDISNGKELPYLEWAFYKGKFYVVEPPMTAVVLLPGVIVYGLALNQTFISVLIGAINASAVYRLMRGLTDKLSFQVWLTLLFTFGTVYWWTAVNGAIYFFAHTLAVLFLFLAIYETLVGRRPFLAGLLLGAAYLTRLPTILALPFFVIMFSDQWLRGSEEKSLLKRIDVKPLLQLGLGLGIFVVLGAIYDYLRFETPLPAAYHHWFSYNFSEGRAAVYDKGLFHITYIQRHLPVVFRDLLIFQSAPPFVVLPQGGTAIWATSPAFVYALFAGVKTRGARVLGLALLLAGLIVALVFARGTAVPGFISRFSRDFPEGLDFPFGLELLPFALLIGLAVFTGFRNRNRLVLACWAAIIPIALTHFTVAVTGFAQFGYRFGLDYYPFLFLLVVASIGDSLKWHHKLLITLSMAINLGAVLWRYEFAPGRAFGVDWLGW